MNDDTWQVPPNIDVNRFPFSWAPDPYDPPYIHQFGTQWQKNGGPKYVVDGATEVKYHDFPKSIALPNLDQWVENFPVENWDYSWHPDANDPPFIHKFGTQWQKNGGPQFIVPGATTVKYHDYPVAKVINHFNEWNSCYEIVDWDYSWHPDQDEPPYIYVWGSDHYQPEVESIITYTVPGAVQYKYMGDKKAKLKLADVVFVSAGEPDEQQRFDTLQQLTGNRTKWIKNIQGRENALKQAALVSETEWFYCFPGKLSAESTFDFSWYPRKSIGAMHYIFYAHNPVNGLQYGHQAAVCYHRQLVLDTPANVLDFTMSQPHDIVPKISGIAQYNLDPFVCWRTAFREAIKLKLTDDEESRQRLHTWLQPTEQLNSHYSVGGARAGCRYFDDVGGDPQKLQASWDWTWLAAQYRHIDS